MMRLADEGMVVPGVKVRSTITLHDITTLFDALTLRVMLVAVGSKITSKAAKILIVSVTDGETG